MLTYCDSACNSSYFISPKKDRPTGYIKLPIVLDMFWPIQGLINYICTYSPTARPTSKNGNEFDLQFSKQGP